MYLGRIGQADKVMAVKVMGTDGSVLATIWDGQSDSPHVLVKTWRNFDEVVDLGGGYTDPQRRFKIRVKCCFGIERIERAA